MHYFLTPRLPQAECSRSCMVAGEVKVCPCDKPKAHGKGSRRLCQMSRRWVTGYGLRGSPLSYLLRPLEKRWGSPEALSANGKLARRTRQESRWFSSPNSRTSLWCGSSSGSVSVRTRDESIWSHNSAMAPLITPSQAADEGDLRAFLGELYLKFSRAMASGANHNKAATDRPHIVNTMFPCSMTGGFALEIFDRRNATDYEIGDIVVLDAEVEPVPGDMVLAAVEKRPVFAKYLPRGQHIVLKPLNPDWGDEVIGPGHLEGRVVAVMTERTHRRRTRE